MPKTDIKLYATDGNTGNKVTTTISYVNPEANNSVLKTMAQKLNALTNNTYISTDRVETIEVDTDTSRKSFRNLQIEGAIQGAKATISFNRDASESTLKPLVLYYISGNLQVLELTDSSQSTSEVAIYECIIPNQSGVIYAGLAEKNTFYSEFARQSVE